MARRSTKKTAKRSTKRRSTAKKTTKRSTAKKVKTPVEPWKEIAKKFKFHEVVVLDMPWGTGGIAREHGAVNISGLGWVIAKDDIVPTLEPYAARSYTWLHYVQDRANNTPYETTEGTGKIVLREDQVEDRDAIVRSFTNGAPEYLLASLTGVGKTVTAVAAIKGMPGREVLIVCPKSVMAGWRYTIDAMGNGGKRWVIINYESTKKLIKPPASALRAKKTATKNKNIALHGTPWFSPDIVVTDEAHKTSNQTSQQTRIVEKFLDTGARSLRITATPGENPAKLHYLRRGLAYATGSPVFSVGEKDFSDYVRWANTHGVKGLIPAKFGNGLDFDGDADSLKTMHNIIYSRDKPWATRRKPEGWPEQLRTGRPVELTPDEMELYAQEWELFKKEMQEVGAIRSNPKSTKRQVKAAATRGLAAQTRYRQKVGQLKVPYVMDMVRDELSNDHQVVLTVVFQDTVDALANALRSARISFVELTGRNVATREENRIKFQRGEAKVAIVSINEGINLQANEKLSGGNDAPRTMIVVEPKWSAVDMVQQLGRSHRNGEDSPALFPMAVGTIDERVVEKLLVKMISMSTMSGEETDDLRELADVFGFDLVV